MTRRAITCGGGDNGVDVLEVDDDGTVSAYDARRIGQRWVQRVGSPALRIS